MGEAARQRRQRDRAWRDRRGRARCDRDGVRALQHDPAHGARAPATGRDHEPARRHRPLRRDAVHPRGAAPGADLDAARTRRRVRIPAGVRRARRADRVHAVVVGRTVRRLGTVPGVDRGGARAVARAPRRRRMIRRLVLAVALAALPLAAAAQDSLESAKRSELEAIQRQAQEKRRAAQELKGQENMDFTQTAPTERQLNLTRKRLRTLDSKRQALGQQLDVTRVNLVRSRQALQIQRERLSERLRNLYKYGAERQLEFLLSTQSFAQLLTRWDFLVMVAEQDRMLVEDV